MKLDDNLISASIAHGLTPGVLATWDSRIARTPRVLVPIQLDVLMVRKEGGTWAKTAMQVPDAGTTPAAHTLLAEPFAERDARAPGAYLHWALPDALTRGAGTAHGGDVSFPPVPDRWLVVRVSTPKIGSRRALTAWVLESGGAEPVVTPLDAWFEPEDPDRTTTPGAEPLTALGHGDAVWSAYYDNVENRLAFYDDLADARGPVAYLVCGWHSRHVDDPIGENLSSPTAFEARLDELGWEVDPADVAAAFVYADTRVTAATKLGLAVREATFERVATAGAGSTVKPVGVREDKPTLLERDGSAVLARWAARAVSWPELTLYHGAVVGLGWPGPGIGVAPDGLLGGDAGGPPAAGSVTVTVGNTLVEALAARLAHNTGNQDEARILEAVLLGGTAELDAPDAPARIDALLHAAGFAGLPGGTRAEPVTQHAVAPPTSVVADPSRTAPGVFAGQTTPPVRATTSPAKGGTAGTLAGRVQDAAQLRISPQLRHGGMDSVLRRLKDGLRVDSPVRVGVPRPPGADAPAQTVDSERPLPRFFVPSDPVFLLEGAGRSYKHGFDDLHSETGALVCRLSGHTVRSLSPYTLSEGAGGAVRGEDLLARGLDHGGIPPECEDLLRELALLDPGGAETAAAVSAVGRGLDAERLQVNARVYAVEQTAWWIARDDRRDVAPLLAYSGFDGTLPSPVAVAMPVTPWVPLHLDWQVDLYAATDLAGWDLKEVDFDAAAATVPAPDADPVQTLSGRALLGGGAARVAAATVRTVLEQAQLTGGSAPLKPGVVHAFNSPAARAAVEKISAMRSVHAEKAFRSAVHAAGGGAEAEAAATAADLDHVADELEKMDVLVGAMDRFTSKLRAGYVADGTDAPVDGAVPPEFWPVRSGFLKVTRLRLVDAFGQTLDLLGSGADTPAAADQVLRSEPLTVADRADLVELAPRFTAPTRLWFRFVSADDDAVDASDSASPVCGFVLPNHLDGDLQLYAADGAALGAVRFDADAGVVWEESPGQPSTVGASPASIVPNRHLAGLAQGLLDWGAVDSTPDTPQHDTALSSLLRIIDTSLWSVDPFGHVGEEHLALLVGHPLAVLRGLVRVEVAEPVDPARVAGLRVPVRIGALAHWQDGLLAYLVGDDAHTLHVPDPAVTDFARPIGPHQGFNGQATTTSSYYDRFADDLGVVADPGATPVDHPYVDTSGVLWVQPGQDVHVTMLVEPHGVVSATTGFLPRKQIGMRRAWVAPGLARLAPLFRFGPVLLDPNLIRMPVASDIRGTWSWSHRKDATTWADEPVTNSLGDARLPPDPSEGQEGWLRLTPDEPLP